jgi:putative flippase GtrA
MTLNTLLDSRPARYLVVGAVSAAANNVIMIGGDAAGMHYWVAVLLTFMVVPPSYIAHALWVFGVRTSWAAFGHYVAGTISSFLVMVLTIGLLRGVLLLPMVAAAPIATLVMVLYNYLMTRWAVYRGCDRATPSFADPTA